MPNKCNCGEIVMGDGVHSYTDSTTLSEIDMTVTHTRKYCVISSNKPFIKLESENES